MEVVIKSTKIVTEFDTSKTYVFSKYRCAEFRKFLDICGDVSDTKAWLDEMHDCYVKPVSSGNGIAHYVNHNGELTKVLVMPQDCCELEVLKF